MNYLSIYKQIIRKAQKEREIRLFNKKNKLEYYEAHHGIPKCIMIIRKPHLNTNKRSSSNLMNKSWNTVLLTCREHFLIHMILARACKQIYGNEHVYTEKSIESINRFLYRRSDTNKQHRITSKVFSNLKKDISKIRSKTQTGKPAHNRGISPSPYTREQISVSLKKYYSKNPPIMGNTGIPATEARKKKTSISLIEYYIKNPKPTGKDNHRFGISPSDEIIKKRALAQKEYWVNNPKPRGKNNKKSLHWELQHEDGRMSDTYNLKEWSKINGYQSSNISAIKRGERKRHKDIIGVKIIPEVYPHSS